MTRTLFLSTFGRPAFAAHLPVLLAPLFYALLYILFFSPALMEGRILAPGDGYLSYYPAISIPWQLWEPNILAGYPVFADPQFFLWYPPRWIFRDYNTFMIFAYVAAGSFSFGYIYWKTGSTAAALIAGAIYGTGSFMVGHLGHASVVQTAAWLPLIAWTIDALSHRRTATRFAIGALAVALCLLGGHPQIFVYAMILAGGMAVRNLWFASSEGMIAVFRLACVYVGMVVVGVSACAVQLLPFLEFSGLSARTTEWSYGEFVTYSLPLRQIATIFFPYLYGGGLGNPTNYFGAWNQTELATYAGLGALFLAASAILARQRNDGALFWLGAAALSLLLATVGQNGLGHFVYKIPVIGSFRAAARSAIAFTFAISVLAGMAIDCLQRGQVTTRHIILAAKVALSFAIAAGVATLCSKQWQQALRDAGVSPWAMIEATILPPLISLVAMICLLLLWKRMSGRYLMPSLVVAAVVLDVSQFGWYGEWRFSPIQKQAFTDWPSLREDLSNANGRLLAMPEAFAHEAFQPNINLLYGIRSASGYGPLEPKAYQEATGIDTTGSIHEIPSASLRRVLGITHIVFGRRPSANLKFGSCAAKAGDAVLDFDLPVPVRATAIRVISNMSCSIGRPDGDPVLIIDATDGKESGKISLVAGRDTSEWAHDRPDVLQIVQHARAPIKSSFQAGGFSGHSYEANLSLAGGGEVEVRRLALNFLGRHGGILNVQKIELINTENGAIYPLNPAALKLGSSGTIHGVSEDLSVAEFQKDRGELAWLVGNLLSTSTEIAAMTVRSGVFPDGQPFDPNAVAIVEGVAPKVDAAPAGPRGKVELLSEESVRVALRVTAPSRSFLFLSRAYHPGWVGYVNGEKVQTYRSNGAFQGVVVPAGVSEVTLILESASLKLGAQISLVSLLVIAAAFLTGIAGRFVRSDAPTVREPLRRV
ncbi:hypothetical protein CWO90_03750 [Bradyrhizobium sp. Leo121]|nr:hypothetical protein CWO90_03750 [Bradyrhizobium sp. Leo121]